MPLLLHLTLCRLKQHRHLIWTVHIHKGSHQLHCNYFIYKLHLVKTGLVRDMNKTGSTHTTHCICMLVFCGWYCNTEKLSIANPSISQLSRSLFWLSVTSSHGCDFRSIMHHRTDILFLISWYSQKRTKTFDKMLS